MPVSFLCSAFCLAAGDERVVCQLSLLDLIIPALHHLPYVISRIHSDSCSLLFDRTAVYISLHPQFI